RLPYTTLFRSGQAHGQNGREGHQEVELGDADDDLGDPHHHVVHLAPEVAGGGPVDQADGGADQDADDPHEEGPAPPVPDPGEDVPPVQVGAQGVDHRRRIDPVQVDVRLKQAQH